MWQGFCANGFMGALALPAALCAQLQLATSLL